jgi:GntR family transcriptional regulator, transcriptional repressor for pyruvate dehydrogenase complex
MSSDNGAPGGPEAVPDSRTKLSEALATALLREIREQGMTPGTRLPSERELMRRFGTGRSTIREVVNGLAILGALEIRPGHGVFVLDPDAGRQGAGDTLAVLARGTTGDLFEARRLIEVHTARLAAGRRTETDLADLGQIVDAHARAIAARRPAVEYVRRFHARLAWAARNELLAGAVEYLVGCLNGSGRVLERLEGYRDWELREHDGLLAAVASADAERAGARMAGHLGKLVAWHDRLREPPEPWPRPGVDGPAA